MSQVVAIRERLVAAVSAAVSASIPPEVTAGDPVVQRSEHADFQSNASLVLSKKVSRAPRDLAATLVDHFDEWVTAEVSGPGFLNLTVDDRVILDNIERRLGDDRIGVGLSLGRERVVVDYSGPNVAKEMHVGHLRSTIIGDTLARVFGHLGAEVVRQNHVGDWGTQFGMLIQYIDEHPDAFADSRASISNLDALYRKSRATFDSDADFKARARERVVDLQAGDEATLATWQALVDESARAFQTIYQQLGALLTSDDLDGESRYNSALPGVVDELVALGVAVESEGAIVTYTDGVLSPEGDPVALIIRKRDGGYGYAATDLATLRLRVEEYRADRILYVVDARQALHFRMVFDAAHRAGWLPESVEARHVPFGTVLGKDGRPFKTRSGDTVKLADLLTDAVDRARDVLAERSVEIDPVELEAIAAAAGVGAVKYADLSSTRTKDYVFDVDQMVAFNGNTGVYLQYAHARVSSILRKARNEGTAVSKVHRDLPLEPAERALALSLDEFDSVLRDVTDTLEPHRLCNYLFGLAKSYTEFYESCPVLKAAEAPVRENRLALCELTGRTLAAGLELLGIQTPERM